MSALRPESQCGLVISTHNGAHEPVKIEIVMRTDISPEEREEAMTIPKNVIDQMAQQRTQLAEMEESTRKVTLKGFRL